MKAMVEEVKLRLTKELSEVIDKYREGLTREEFIDLCVRTFLKDQGSVIPQTEKVEPPQEVKVTKEVPKVEEKKVKAQTLTVTHGPVVRQETVTEKVVEMKEFPGAKYLNDPLFTILWLAAVGMYGLGDLITTNWALQLGLIEANPIAAIFRSIVNMALFKVATIIAAFLISYITFHSKTLIFSAPAMMLIAGIILTVNNLSKIYHVV